MGYLKYAALGLFFIANLAAAGVTAPPLWDESANGGGDAGDRNNPQSVTPNTFLGTGGGWAGFSGDVGGCLVFGEGCDVFDTVDAFKFYFTGGQFTGPFEFGGSDDTVRRLFREAGLVQVGGDQTGNPNVDDYGLLDPGNYIWEITMLGIGDPPFTIGPIAVGPEGGNNLFPILAPAAAPAPGVLALMLVGLAGFAVARRRARTA
jgi:hypothetical protein